MDNCGNTTTVQTQGPLYNPFLFPAETTTNEFTGMDSALNIATCSFNVTIEDTENPTIICPNEVIRPCNKISPADAGNATTTDNCDGVKLTYFDNTDNVISGNCPMITIRKWQSTDWKSNTNTCTQKIIEVDHDAFTDAANCLYDSESVEANFVDDIQGIPFYTLSSTAPDQFAYHVFHVGQPGEMMAVTFHIPYPFVTRGTTPIIGYDWLDIKPGSGLKPCFENAGNIFFKSNAQIFLDDFETGECGDSKQVLVHVITPDTGFIRLSINLDVGPKKIMKRKGTRNTESYVQDAYDLKRGQNRPEKCKFHFSSVAIPSNFPIPVPTFPPSAPSWRAPTTTTAQQSKPTNKIPTSPILKPIAPPQTTILRSSPKPTKIPKNDGLEPDNLFAR